MPKTRIYINLAAAAAMLFFGARFWYRGTYHKTGDIADIYMRQIGTVLMALAALGMITLFISCRRRR